MDGEEGKPGISGKRQGEDGEGSGQTNRRKGRMTRGELREETAWERIHRPRNP